MVLTRPAFGGVQRATTAYGWSLLATHAVVWIFFAQTRMLWGLTEAQEPYCWPYFESCWQWRLRSPGQAALLQTGYLAIGLATAVALRRGRRALFWWGLLALNLYLFALVSLDYRLRANEFYMLFWVNGAFLAAPRSRWLVPLTIASCYFWAGILKLNVEWLSGSVLYHDLWLIPSAWTPAACAYVVVLEVVMIWGLLARRRAIVALVLGQLALFHIQSLSQIHWFYPLLMAAILSWFVLDRLLSPSEGRANLRDLIAARAPRGAYVLLALFAVMQLAPHAYRGDSTLTGQGRIFALHMFEARQQCEVFAMLVSGERLDLKVPLSPRMICDPVVYFSRAQNLCRTRRASDPAFDLHLIMRSKRTTDPAFQTIIDAQAFCAAEHTYRVFGNNDWLQ
jgi:hypothetical protein